MSPADPQDLPPWEVERLPEVPQPEHGTTRSQTGMPALPTHKPFNSFPLLRVTEPSSVRGLAWSAPACPHGLLSRPSSSP